MTFGSLFSGVGGFEYGLERAGWTTSWQIENDPFCTRVLERRWPGVHRWGDARTLWADEQGGKPRLSPAEGSSGGIGELHSAAGRIDLLVGGFPCQDLSVAGKRAGLGGERSGLFWEIVRIAKILTPAWGLFENVPGLLSSDGGRDMGLVLAGLRKCWPAVGYRILDSRHFGVAQRRRRLFFVCGPDEARVATVLFEPEGGGGNPAAGEEAGARVAAGLTSGSHRAGVNDPGRRAEDDVNLVAYALLAPKQPRNCAEKETFIVAGQQHGSDVGEMGALRSGHGDVQSGVPFVFHPLKAKGHDGSEDGTGRGAPIIAVRTSGHAGTNNLGLYKHGDAPTLDGSMNVGIVTPSAMAVRRLTPTECERLQGFPEGWTCLCLPLDEWAHNPEDAAERCTCPDSPRYRALGNAVTATVVEWIGRRLLEAMAP